MAKMSQRKFRKDLESTTKASEEAAKSSAATRASEAKASSDEFKQSMAAKPAAARKAAPASGGSFGSAFASARKAGDKTFTWKGKSYTTEMAGAKKSAPAKAAPAPTKAAPAKASPAKPAAKPSAVDTFKAASSAGRTAAFTHAKSGPPAGLARKESKPFIDLRMTSDAERTKKQAERVATGSKPGATSKEKFYAKYPKALKRGGTTGPSTTAPTTPDAAKQRREFEAEMMRRNKAGQDAGKREGTKNLDYRPEGTKGMKKYAKGGAVDGCAKKGKTKGTMVKMARGGMAMQRGTRNEFGGVARAKGGSCGMKKGK